MLYTNAWTCENVSYYLELQINDDCFHANLVVFIKGICGKLFKCHLHEKESLRFPTFCMKMNHFNIVFHMTGDDGKAVSPASKILELGVQFFQ